MARTTQFTIKLPDRGMKLSTGPSFGAVLLFLELLDQQHDDEHNAETNK